MELSKSKCKIVNKKLLQNNSVDISKINITELEDEDHKEPSVTEKVKSYFNIF